MKFVLLKSFVRKYDRYNKQEQKLILDTLKEIQDYITSNKAPYGLRIKKLSDKIYEARINIHLRIAFFKDKNMIKFFCLGNHEDIKRMLKTFR